MNAAWDNAKKLAEKHATQGGIFVRLQNDGDSVVGVFCGEPYAKEVYWDGQKYCDAMPDGGGKMSLRVSLNFYVPSEGTMKIIEGGTAWFKDLLEVREKYGTDKWVFEVKRRGRKGDTKTKYSILPEKQVDDALRARIAAAGEHDLGAAAGGEGDSIDSTPRTVDLEVARTIAERLRALPRDVADVFLAEFKIGRIRDLLNSDVPRAMAFVDRAIKPAENDPLAV